MAKPVALFVYVGAYGSEADARFDYEGVKDLHALGAVGDYDAAVVAKDADGKVHINKDETAARRLGWGGAGVGALVGILFPPSILASAVVVGAAGAAAGHLWKGMSRDDVKDLGQAIDAGEAALVVIGEVTIEPLVRDAIKGAKKHVAKQVNISTGDIDAELRDAAEQLKTAS